MGVKISIIDKGKNQEPKTVIPDAWLIIIKTMQAKITTTISFKYRINRVAYVYCS